MLGERLSLLAGRDDILTLGLPRGGVPVAYEVARAVGSPLDVFVVRKLGVPGQEELALGAVAHGLRVLNDEVVWAVGLSDREIDAVADVELAEVERRTRRYRGDRAPLELAGKTAILVDDGLATGATMRVAARAVRRLDPARVVVAVPVAPQRTLAALREDADEVVCLLTPEPFYAVGLSYETFDQTSDEEVRELLAASASG